MSFHLRRYVGRRSLGMQMDDLHAFKFAIAADKRMDQGHRYGAAILKVDAFTGRYQLAAPSGWLPFAWPLLASLECSFGSALCSSQPKGSSLRYCALILRLKR